MTKLSKNHHGSQNPEPIASSYGSPGVAHQHQCTQIMAATQQKTNDVMEGLSTQAYGSQNPYASVFSNSSYEHQNQWSQMMAGAQKRSNELLASAISEASERQNELTKMMQDAEKEKKKAMEQMNAILAESQKKADEERAKLNSFLNSDECSSEERKKIELQFAMMENNHQMQMADIQMSGMRARQRMVDNLCEGYQTDALIKAGIIPEKVVNGVGYHYKNPINKASSA